MLDNLKNQERLSQQQEDRIDRNIRIAILAMTGVAVALIIWALVLKKPVGTWYYALIIMLLAAVWFIKCVLGGLLKHSLAQRTEKEVAAYLKAAGLEFVSYAGLVWFLIGMDGKGIFGAVVYMFGMVAARKQRETYYGISDEETDTQKTAEHTGGQEADGPEADSLQTDGANSMGADPIEQDTPDALPTAANRLQREKEPEDGSV